MERIGSCLPNVRRRNRCSCYHLLLPVRTVPLCQAVIEPSYGCGGKYRGWFGKRACALRAIFASFRIFHPKVGGWADRHFGDWLKTIEVSKDRLASSAWVVRFGVVPAWITGWALAACLWARRAGFKAIESRANLLSSTFVMMSGCATADQFTGRKPSSRR